MSSLLNLLRRYLVFLLAATTSTICAFYYPPSTVVVPPFILQQQKLDHVIIDDNKRKAIALKGKVVEVKCPLKEEQSPKMPILHEQKTSLQLEDIIMNDAATTIAKDTEIAEGAGDISGKVNTIEELTTTTTTASKSVPSTPCNRICRYNAGCYDGQVCIGCFRDCYEIGSWTSMTSNEKYFALMDAADRVEITKAAFSDDQDNNSNNKYYEGSITYNELMRQAQYWQERSKNVP